MSLVTINRNPTRRQLNQFGFIWLGFMTFFGVMAWFKFSAPLIAAVLWMSAVVIPVIGWVFPAFMRVVFVGMSFAAWPIGFVVSHVILALVYYLVVTPIGLVMRVVGYDPMSRHSPGDGASRWVQRDVDRNAESYFRQF